MLPLLNTIAAVCAVAAGLVGLGFLWIEIWYWYLVYRDYRQKKRTVARKMYVHGGELVEFQEEKK